MNKTRGTTIPVFSFIRACVLLAGAAGLSMALGACAALTGATGGGDKGAVVPEKLRCEYLCNPLGLDVAAPRLGWVLVSQDPAARGCRQSAFRILVAGSRENLQNDQGDLWDSGKKLSSRTLHVVYDGKPLASRMRCWWKVRVWDQDGKPSPWSEPAFWSMGLLRKSDWQAEWITDANTAEAAAVNIARAPHNGYHSALAKRADTEKWVVLDLGEASSINGVRLFPARPYNWQPDTPGFLFPLRFCIEAAKEKDFSDSIQVLDCTNEDVALPGMEPRTYRFDPVTARYVRLRFTRLRSRDQDAFGLALAEMQVLSGEDNLAQGAAVKSLDSVEAHGWSREYLVDGRLGPDKGEARSLPAAMLRKEFSLPSEPEQATLYVTAKGLYEIRLNGARVGDHVLAPEWTDYNHRIQYQAYDVTPSLRKGANAFGVILCEGWYAGRLFLAPLGRQLYGALPQLLLRLDVDLADGSSFSLVSDGSWRGTDQGPIRSSSIFDGEVYDASRAMPAWDRPDFADQAWEPVSIQAPGPADLVWQCNQPIRMVRDLKPVAVTEPKPGMYIFDLGQNMVGWCRLKVSGPEGTAITLRHGEMLNPDCTLFTENLGSAAQTDRFVLGNRGEEELEPHFTYHGFRYVEVTGLPAAPGPDFLTGRVFHSHAPDTGFFECSSPLLNRLMASIVWTQRANMMSIPTDCPQRSERAGWMGDIQAFAQTAVFNMDMAAFFGKWVRDVRDGQAEDGRFPDFAPVTVDPNRTFSGVPAWGDAGTVVPWRMFQNYGDTRILEEHFQAARRWVDFILENNPGLIWEKGRGNDYNDWLNSDTFQFEGLPRTGGAVPKEVFATAFFAHSTEIVSKMARVLGRSEEAAYYDLLFEKIKAAFIKAFVLDGGRIQGDTQAGYALALRFNLLPDALRPQAAQRMIEALAPFKGHLSTGIQTTHRLLLELTRNGFHQEACRLVQIRTFPSWGYMIDQGATTIWERWDGFMEGRGFKNSGMNSYNHWAFGAVGEWIWRHIAGINPDDAKPAFKHFVIHPRPGKGLTWAKGDYESIRGRISSHWKIEKGLFRLEVTVPVNTEATVFVPTSDADKVLERGVPARAAEGIQCLGVEGNAAKYRVGSGAYVFIGPY